LLGHSLRRTQCTPHSAHRAPPCIWTFLSSLDDNKVFNSLLAGMTNAECGMMNGEGRRAA
jgi:hypothetical protein